MKSRRNLLLSVFLLLFLGVSMVACQKDSGNESESTEELSEMKNTVVKLVEYMDAKIAPSNVENESFKDSPWIQSKVDVEGLDRPVSLDVVENYMNAYRYYTGKELDYLPSDFIALINEDNEEVYQYFEDFIRWTWDNGSAKKKMYMDGTRSAYLANYEVEGSRFNDKELPQMTANDFYQLALWAQENPHAGDQLEEEDKYAYQVLIEAYMSN